MATKTEKNVQLKINKMTKNIFDQLSAQGLISEDELYLLSDDETGSATWGAIGGELSNQTDLKIMLDSKADKSQIPTVNNPTITFTQGNSVKGSITLNQVNDQTISLDAGGGGGGGGGDIPADLSCNHLSVGTGIVVGQPNTTPNKGKGTLVVNTLFGGTNTYSAFIDGIAIGSRAVVNHIQSIAIGCAEDATAQTTNQNQLAICAGNYGNAYDTADHILLGGNQRDPKSLTEFIREVAAAATTAENFKFAPYDPTSGHSQEGSNINIGNSYSYYDKGIICFIVKFGENAPFTLEWQDPVTYNTVQEDIRISNNDSSTTELTQLFVVPCTFGYGVNIYNNYGYSMKVDEIFRIEIENAYSI